MDGVFCTRIEHPEKVFLTSDTHFHHANILKYCNRPFATVEEMNEAIINNWNSVVGEDDHVYHLGDFCFGGVGKLNSIIMPDENGKKKLNGHIHLILGNHDPDRISKSDYSDFFEEITYQKYLILDGWSVFLNHFPFLDFSNNYDTKVIQLHGHIHSSPNNTGTLNNERYKVLKWNQYDVGVDNNNYKPVSWKEVKAIIESRRPQENG